MYYLLALLCATSARAIAEVKPLTSPADPFYHIARLAPKYDGPVCCLRPLDPVEPIPEIPTFEEWKENQSQQQKVDAETSTPTSETPQSDKLHQEQTESVAPLADTVVQQEGGPHNPHVFDRVPLTDRFNYASEDCSSSVHKTHNGAQSAPAVLSRKKDKYMLTPCSTKDKFMIVELCDDIRIDTVQLANFEFFSGVFRTIKISVAQTYRSDTEGWVEMGTYEAKKCSECPGENLSPVNCSI